MLELIIGSGLGAVGYAFLQPKIIRWMERMAETRETIAEYPVSVVADSITYFQGLDANHNTVLKQRRITTLSCTYPRFIHAQVMTHRMFSRNAASSRAIPSKKLRELMGEHASVPVFWGKNQKGMQATEEVADVRQAKAWWHETLSLVKAQHEKGEALGLHKQILNRVIEPFLPITLLITATEWDNFFAQRCHDDAQPEIKKLACAMRQALADSQPTVIHKGEYHLPFITDEERKAFALEDCLKVSVARCARTSYLAHTTPHEFDKDIELHNRLLQDKHMSPFEHQATPADHAGDRSGNFTGFIQYRQLCDKEQRRWRL